MAVSDVGVDVNKIGKVDDESVVYQNGRDGHQEIFAAISKKPKSGPAKIKEKSAVSRGDVTDSEFFVVAKVNDDAITNVDILNAIRVIFVLSGKQFNPNNARLMVRSILQREIDGRLQSQVAARNKMSISPHEVSAKISEIAERNGMSVKELGQKFESMGINMSIFRKSIESRMLFSAIVEAMKNDIKLTPQEIAEEKKRIMDSTKQKRYHLFEIHLRVPDKNSKPALMRDAQVLLNLLKDGFSFQVLAESISQGNYKLQVGDLDWVTPQNMEAPVWEVVQKLQPGEFSGIIETKSGIKIVFLDDIAEPNKKGNNDAIYKYMRVNLQYKGGLMTSSDVAKADTIIFELKSAKCAGDFKKTCEKYNLAVEEKEENPATPYLVSFLEAAQTQAVTVQSPDDENFVGVYYTVAKDVPSVDDVSDNELKHTIISKQVAKIFQRNFKQAENVAFIKIDKDKLDKLVKER